MPGISFLFPRANIAACRPSIPARDVDWVIGRSLAEMIKLVYCITRRPDLSLEQFSTYWHDLHGPLGRRIPRLRRPVHLHTLLPPPGQRMDFDGMARLGFDN